MNAFVYGTLLQWKLDLRNRNVLLTYYVVPLIFFGFMGGIFTTINPQARDTLIPSMLVFGITMGALLGAPVPLVEVYGSGVSRAYKVGGIPLWVAAATNLISACIHLLLMSMVIVLLAGLVFGAVLPDHPLWFIAQLAFFILISLTLGTLLGLCFHSASRLTMASQLLFLPSIMLSGIMFPARLLPDVLQGAGWLLPASWGFGLLQQNGHAGSAVTALLAIAATVLILSCWRLVRMQSD
ncbi:ABC transporter permease [Paenibacillus donghaensis]|uniref:ABC transporter n=1 Tax=Paenibacillus donghaensis TaxID=414771 RepID=A0A2Z2K6U1_9BACL|nr:ABC transporter permease [Paenibacillus donghaensis]ASA20607.1 ABC transporter [Paenibacillus donghaensis]